MKNINDFNMDFFSLKGKNAIVTGGVSGLGQAFALALAKAGANIFVFAAVDDDGTTKKLIEACGVKYAFMLGDITEDGSVIKLLTNVWKLLEALIFWLTVQVSARSQMFLTLAELSGIR